MGEKYTSFRIRGRKASLVTDYRLGTVKVKTRSDQAPSLLSSLSSGKKRKTHSSFFLVTATASHKMNSVVLASDTGDTELGHHTHIFYLFISQSPTYRLKHHSFMLKNISKRKYL